MPVKKIGDKYYATNANGSKMDAPNGFNTADAAEARANVSDTKDSKKKK